MISIKRALPEQAPILTGVAVAAKRHWNYPDRWIEIWRPLLTITPELIAGAEVWVAHVDTEIAGFYALDCDEEPAKLEHLWIRPSQMGHGVGRALFTHALDRGRAQRCQALEIVSDPNAQGFYERMGARKIGDDLTEVAGEPRQLPILEIRL